MAEERQVVEEYLSAHSLSAVLNDVVNEVVKARPDDPFTALAEGLKRASKTSRQILKVTAREVPGPGGQPLLQAEVTTAQGSFTAAVRCSGSVRDAVMAVTTILAEPLVGSDPMQQGEIDVLLQQERGSVPDGCVAALSIAACKAGAAHAGLPLYDHIAQAAGTAEGRIPLPWFGLINGGSACAGGPCYVRQVAFVPSTASHHSLAECVRSAQAVHQKVRELLLRTLPDGTLGGLASTAGLQNTNAGKLGGYAPTALTATDAVRIAAAAVDGCRDEGAASLGALALEVAADAMYSDGVYDAAKFDINATAGGMADSAAAKGKADKKAPAAQKASAVKSAEELLQVYLHWLEQHPVTCVTRAFATPLAAAASESAALLSKGTESLAHHHAADLKEHPPLQPQEGDSSGTAPPATPTFHLACGLDGSESQTQSGPGVAGLSGNANALVLGLGQGGLTVSELLSQAQAAKAAGLALVVSAVQDGDPDTESAQFAADLAVGMQATYLIAGGLESAAQRCAVARLLRVEAAGVPFGDPGHDDDAVDQEG
eukprot:TRINITY_DN1517_c0_g2_i1.p1 TRINITY_DN1517_c0_g2~~TRINITY_DN1517_c0_g2_i1.p1  ORF type:complete len:562 (+),score=142.83 TRINITY_DN1517_c0_g2_i1:56-1687(+)